MIEFILIWLFAWLLIVATLQYIYKGRSWFVRYLFLIASPITVIALLIASVIVYLTFRRHDPNVLINFYHANVGFIIKGLDYTDVRNEQTE